MHARYGCTLLLLKGMFVSILAHIRSVLPCKDDAQQVARHWKGDIFAGITVGVVALPLALAFAVASGVSAEMGLITAVVAGTVAAIFGGSNYQVSGPTGAMVVIIAPVTALYGQGIVPLLALMCGFFVFLAGILGLGRAVSLLPWPVIEGFTLGIAGLLFLQQVPNLLGVAAKKGGNTVVTAFRAFFDIEGIAWMFTLMLALLTVLIIVGLGKLSPKIPGSLIAVVVATGVAVVCRVKIPSIGTIPDSLPAPHLPHATMDMVMQLLPVVLAAAALCAIESLLSARVAAGMVPGGSYNPDRELVGQGMANMAAGCFGGLPATGAIARTAVNIRTGGRSRLSAVIHALFFIGVIYLASTAVSYIPLATLAGVLIVTAWNMVSRKNIMQIAYSTRSDLSVLFLTAILTIVLDIIWAVAVGILVAGILVLRRLASRSGIVRENSENPRIAAIRIDGTMFFGVADRMEHEIPKLGGVEVVILRLSRVGVLDASGVKGIGEVVDRILGSGRKVVVLGAAPEVLAMGIRMGLLRQDQVDDHYRDTREAAWERAEEILDELDAAKK